MWRCSDDSCSWLLCYQMSATMGETDFCVDLPIGLWQDYAAEKWTVHRGILRNMSRQWCNDNTTVACARLGQEKSVQRCINFTRHYFWTTTLSFSFGSKWISSILLLGDRDGKKTLNCRWRKSLDIQCIIPKHSSASVWYFSVAATDIFISVFGMGLNNQHTTGVVGRERNSITQKVNHANLDDYVDNVPMLCGCQDMQTGMDNCLGGWGGRREGLLWDGTSLRIILCNTRSCQLV